MTDLSITASAVQAVKVVEQFTGPCDEAVNAGDLVRLDTATGKVTHGNGSSTGEARIAGIAVTTAPYVGAPVTVVRKGLVNVGNALSALAYDADVFASNTDGKMADAAGTVSKIVATVVAANGATTADKLLRVNL